MEDNTKTLSFKDYAQQVSNNVHKYLAKWLPQKTNSDLDNFYESVRYSTLAGGKRIRPLLTIATATALSGSKEQAYRAGCALELIHTYSLIHDDLPSMDNDDYRRGKPTNHKVFGEPIAILAGDGLLTLSFEWLSTLPNYAVTPIDTLKIINIIATSAGINGMVGGQALDLNNNDNNSTLSKINKIHQLKTGMLIKAAVQIGAIIGKANKQDYNNLTIFSEKIGLLFQIIDDILDIEGDIKTLGKSPGADKKLGKATYPEVLGMQKTLLLAKETYQESIAILNDLSVNINRLFQIAEYIYNRNK